MVQHLVDLPPPAASTLEIRRGMDSISAEQYSSVISVHHTFLIELFKSSTDVGFFPPHNVSAEPNSSIKFGQKGMVHRNNC